MYICHRVHSARAFPIELHREMHLFSWHYISARFSLSAAAIRYSVGWWEQVIFIALCGVPWLESCVDPIHGERPRRHTFTRHPCWILTCCPTLYCQPASSTVYSYLYKMPLHCIPIYSHSGAALYYYMYTYTYIRELFLALSHMLLRAKWSTLENFEDYSKDSKNASDF